MSIQSEKESFMKECDEIMRVEKAVIEKIEEAGTRGAHHAETVYSSAEELRKIVYGIRPDHINFIKRHGGLMDLEHAYKNLKDAYAKQKTFYDSQVHDSKDIEEFNQKAVTVFSTCNEYLKRVDAAMKKMADIYARILKF